MLTLILLIVVLALLAFIAWFLVSERRKGEEPKEERNALLIHEQLKEIRGTLDSKMGESNKVIRSITEELTRVQEGNKNVMGFAEQLRSLQDILKNPKQRGVLGEYFLETVLKNVLPANRYRMQYKFTDGEIVDAAIFLEKEKILPIDSKFSLENYNRIADESDPIERDRLEKQFKSDLKMRIDETSKYIRPSENTMDYAFMFIPSEGIYYDLLINKVGTIKTNTADLIEYAFQKKHVIIVSPNTFMAYLQTVLQGLRALQIEESAKEIRVRVEELGRHMAAYGEYHASLGKTLSTAVNHFNRSSREFKKVDKDVVRITGDGSGIEFEALEKPDEE